jgi:hypothetical protein
MEITEVDERTKLRLLRWLIDDVKLINGSLSIQKLIEDLPKFCKNGVLLGDLVNRLHGRDEVIKGLNRNPKNSTAIVANFDKIFGYFREFPRFSSRYLWAQELVMQGHTDVTWGILDDVWYWSQNKISPNDPVASLAPVSDSTQQMKKITTQTIMG